MYRATPNGVCRRSKENGDYSCLTISWLGRTNDAWIDDQHESGLSWLITFARLPTKGLACREAEQLWSI